MAYVRSAYNYGGSWAWNPWIVDGLPPGTQASLGPQALLWLPTTGTSPETGFVAWGSPSVVPQKIVGISATTATLSTIHAGALLSFTSAGNATLTLPASGDTSWLVGMWCEVIRNNTGTLTVVAPAGVFLNGFGASSVVLQRGDIAKLIKGSATPSWYLDVTAAVAGADEVFIGPTDPGVGAGYELWVDSDDDSGGGGGAAASVFEQGVYTPTIVFGITLGTGGRNQARYVYTGGPNVGDYGTLSITGVILLGTGGGIFAGPRVKIKPGFEFAFVLDSFSGFLSRDVGENRCVNSVGQIGGYGMQTCVTPTDITFQLKTADAAYPKQASMSDTAPFVWASGFQLDYSLTVPVVRV